ncbi:unnamed protein product, partial [Scytosiphon promiscuus]
HATGSPPSPDRPDPPPCFTRSSILTERARPCDLPSVVWRVKQLVDIGQQGEVATTRGRCLAVVAPRGRAAPGRPMFFLGLWKELASTP